jgi:hypothetical protein
MILGAQEPPKAADFWSKLLGYDRLQIPADSEWSVTWHHLPPAWVMALVVVPAVLLLIYAFYRGERKDVGTGPKAFMTALRSLAVLLVLLLLMGPVLTVETIKSRKAYILVLLDESRSMQKTDPLQTEKERKAVSEVTGVASEVELQKLSRADIVRKALEHPALKVLEKLEDKLNVAYFTFSTGASSKGDGREAREKFLQDYTKDSAIGTETAIGDSVKAALNSLKGQYIAGVVVFSDGKNNAGMATREIAAQCKQRYLPIYTVLAGVPHTPKDIAIVEPEAHDAVLANDQLTVNLKASSSGYEGEEAEVGLWAYPLKENEKEPEVDPAKLEALIAQSRKEAEQKVTLAGNRQKQPLSLVYSPKTPGEYVLVLRITPRADETTLHNNYLLHRLRVADDKIKILYLEHPPRYEYRFLKNALIRDPKILCHCFLTSADEGFPQEHSRGSDDPLFKEPLQEFPRDLKTLLQFDVILYGDVEPGRLGPDAARNIEAFVSEFGGGIIFLSGMMNNPRSLPGTPLANLLPVIPEETRDLYEHEKIYSDTFGYLLTPDGRNHPIVRFKEFRGEVDRNVEHWEDRDGRRDGLVGVRWFHKVKKLKAGASPLVELTRVPGETVRPPLFVTQFVGRGRVFWSATDETWLWRYLVGDYPWFYPFWQQAMYWVREGKLLGARRYRISVDKERYTRGEKVLIFANAYDEKFERRTDPEIEIYVEHPDKAEREPVRLKKDPARDGVYEKSDYQPSGTGRYRLWAGGDEEASRAYAHFTVYIPDREDDDPVLDEAPMKELAQESHNGKYFTIDQVGDLNKAIQKSDHHLRETKEDDLWDSPLVYLLFALFITTEWVLRKIFRML